MKQIKLDQPIRRMNWLFYGSIGSGKTHLAATFPRPFFMSVEKEHGWTTVQYMNRDMLYEKGRLPIIVPIAGPSDMMEALSVVTDKVNKKEVATVVLDSLSFYGDLYMKHLIDMFVRNNPNKVVNHFDILKGTKAHLTMISDRLQLLDAHVVYLCHEKAPSQDIDTKVRYPGMPMVAGSSRDLIPAQCDVTGYMTNTGGKSFTLHNDVYDQRIARHRFGDGLPAEIQDPTYKKLEQILKIEKMF